MQPKDHIKNEVACSPIEPTTFPERLQKILDGKSARSFAFKADIHPATFHNYLKGTREPQRPEMIAIAKTANVSVEWLATGQGPMECKKFDYPRSLDHAKDMLSFMTWCAGLNQPKHIIKIANLLGFNPNNIPDSIIDTVFDKEVPFNRRLQELARKTGLIEWLLEEIGPELESPPHTLPTQATSHVTTTLEGHQVEFSFNPEMCHLPILDIHVSCGHGITSSCENVKAVFSATRAWIRRELGADPENLALVFASGDSMSDTINSEQIVIVDRSHISQPHDGIWVFLYEDIVYLKRLQFLPGYKVKVMSDNSHYETFTIQLAETSSFRLLGRVIAALPLRKL